MNAKTPDIRACVAIFSVLWVIAGFFNTDNLLARTLYIDNHMLWWLGLAHTLAALVLVLRPTSIVRFTVVCALQMGIIVYKYPTVSNHSVLMFVMNLTMLLSVVGLIVRLRTCRVSLQQAYENFAPVLRIELLIVYFWAAFHKLNSDFFMPGLSCGESLSRVIQYSVPALPVDHPVLFFLSTYGTVLVEATIPVLLWTRRYRLYGLLLAGGLHLALAFAAATFSAFIFAPLFLFVPVSLISDRVHDLWRIWDRAAISYVLVFGTATLFGWLAMPRFSGWGGTGVAWIFLVSLVALLRQPSRFSTFDGFRTPSKELLVLPFLLIVLGAGPYLGLNTVHAFAMFSNLRTDGGQTNHLLVPEWIQVANYQRDLVTVVYSSDPILDRFASQTMRPGPFYAGVFNPDPNLLAPFWKLPYLRLRSLVRARIKEGGQDILLEFERQGRTITIEQAEKHPDFIGMSPFLKLIQTRMVPESSAGYCLW